MTMTDDVKCNTNTFPNAVNTVLRELEKRNLPLTYHEWVDKNPKTGKHEGHLFVVDKLWHYYLKWEENNYKAVYKEVNDTYKEELMESGSNARTFSQEKFQFYKHSVGIFSILFGDRTQPVIYQATNAVIEDKGFKIVQKYNKEPVWVIEDKNMQVFTKGDTEDLSTIRTYIRTNDDKKVIEDTSQSEPIEAVGAEIIQPEPEPEPEEEKKTDVNIDEPPDDYVQGEEQSKMDDFFGGDEG